jgi:glycerol-3-phosphate dehydrogenase (NAD(P)+)
MALRTTILGTGGWGLALGKALFANGASGNSVRFWTPSAQEAELLAREREYKDKLPGVSLPAEFQYFTQMDAALEGAELVLIVVPSQFMDSTAAALGKWKPGPSSPIVASATKGILERTGQRMSQVILDNVPWLSPEKMVALSGPSHAEEVARGVYTAIVSACVSEASARLVQQALSGPSLRVYTGTDVVGVELCGSVKNVVAIAGGILDGLGDGMGDNTKAALITRGQAEIQRLGMALGANPHTFAGLAGMGDLIVTCMSQHSRNRFVGEQVGKGQKLSEVLSGMKMVAEGVPTCRSTQKLAAQVGIEMPIVDAVHSILFDGANPRAAVEALMTRALKSEYNL